MSKREKFSKREAVAMTEMEGATIRQIANGLDISEGMLGCWPRELRQHGDQAYIGQGRARDEEVMRLNRQLAKTEQERDFLQKAAAFFAKG